MFRVVNVHPRTYDPGTSRIRKGTILERLYKTQSVRFRSSSSHVESSRSPFMQKKTRDSMIEDDSSLWRTRAFTHERTAPSFGPSPVGNQEGSWKRLWPFRRKNTHVPSNAPPIYDTRANACTHWIDPTNPTARVNVHLLSRFIQSIYPSIYPDTRALSILHIHSRLPCMDEGKATEPWLASAL